MSENNIKCHGLCSTCENAPSCTFPQDPDRPVFFCEEFQIEKISSIMPPGKAQPLSTDSAAAEDKESTKLIGLCSDCENRQACVFPKPEGGVWHCEEYQ